MAMMRAMNHDISNSSMRDEAFNTTLNLIDNRIVDGDLMENPSKSELRVSEKRIEQMRRSMVEELAHGRVQFSRSDNLQQRLGFGGGYSISEISSALGYWSERGMVDNAMILQMTNLIKSERENLLMGKNINTKRINLFGVKALALWLYKGEKVMDDYIAYTIAQSDNDKLKKYLTTLQQNFKRNEMSLNDRAMVIKSLTTLVPKKCADAETTRLLDCRKALGAVFPVKWLFR